MLLLLHALAPFSQVLPACPVRCCLCCDVTDGHSAIALDRTASFQALYFGHIANYQSRGVYNAPEQLSLYGDGGAKGTRYYSDSFRAQVGAGEVDIGAETNVLRFFFLDCNCDMFCLTKGLSGMGWPGRCIFAPN